MVTEIYFSLVSQLPDADTSFEAAFLKYEFLQKWTLIWKTIKYSPKDYFSHGWTTLNTLYKGNYKSDFNIL